MLLSAFKDLIRLIGLTFNFAAKVIRDPILEEINLLTMGGKNYLFCQIRRDKNGNKYVIIKSKGGDATVFVGIEKESVRELVTFLNNKFLEVN